jgi:alcohol dehydrogenase
LERPEGEVKEFTVPRNIFYGFGAIADVTRIPAKRAMIVSDQVMAGIGWVERVKKILEDNGTDVGVFAEVEPDPSRDTVAIGAEAMLEHEPEVVVGLGGGSSIDAGKAMWVFYEMPDTKWEVVNVPFSLPTMRKKARYIAVPSTSGTGTEVGIGAVITDKASDPPVKKSIDSYELTPDVAIIDPELCLTMPPEVTANTGMDVISHALEGYVAAGANEFSDGLSIKALQLVFEWLPRAYSDGSDREARERMHYASAIAGLAFNNAGLGLTHSLAHQLGSVWGVPHGRANALMLPYVVAFNAATSGDRYAEVAAALGVEQESMEDSVATLIERIGALGDQVGMPRSIGDVGIAAEEFEARLDDIAQNALDDACTGDNVRQPTVDELKDIYRHSGKGTTPRMSS